MVAIAVVLTVVGFVVKSPAAPRADSAIGTVAAAPPSTTTTTTTTTAATTAITAITGNVVEREGARWRVGREGDVVVLGDWGCTGTAVPAVLRPTTGEVWVFASWADAPTAGHLLATVPGAVDARAERAGNCDRLEVLDAQGRSTMLG